jgi:hypothetical protein
MYISIYVDDIIIACADVTIIVKIKAEIMAHYKCKDLGVMNWYLGMRYKRDPVTDVSTLDQSKYAEDVVTKFSTHFSQSPFIKTPMEQNITLHKWTDAYGIMLSAESKEAIADFPYRQIVGSLVYLAIWTRRDIAYAVHSVAKDCANPTLEAMHACQRILDLIC